MKEFDFKIKDEPKDEEPWYSNQIVCTECPKKDELLKNAEAYPSHIEDCHKVEMENLKSENERLSKERDNLIKELNMHRSETEYVVEKILAHEIVRNGGTTEWRFLIRWKGFDSSFDTWERKENLHCPAILKKYLKANNLN